MDKKSVKMLMTMSVTFADTNHPISLLTPHPHPIPTPTPDQSAYHARTPNFEKHPYLQILDEKKNIPFSTEIADFEAQ